MSIFLNAVAELIFLSGRGIKPLLLRKWAIAVLQGYSGCQHDSNDTKTKISDAVC